jgi:hypothetical protein
VKSAIGYTPQPLTADTVAQVPAQLTQARLGAPGFSDSIAGRLYRPASLPAVSRALFDDTGRLWLCEQPPRGSAEAVWRVFTPDGRERFDVTLPVGFRLGDVEGGRLLGTVLDADDVPIVVQFRLSADH